MGDYLVVSDISVAANLSKKESKNSFGVVSLDGDMIAKWGGIKGGKKSHDEMNFIGRQDQLTQLKQESKDIEIKIGEIEKQKEKFEQSQHEKLQQKDKIQHERETAEKDLSETKLNISQIKYEATQAKEHIAKIDQEVISLNQKIELTQQNMESLGQEIESDKELRTTKEESISHFNQEVDALVMEREKLSQKVNQLKLNLVQLQNEQKAIQGDINRGNSIVSEGKLSIENKNKELVKNKNQDEELTNRIEELTSSLAKDYDLKEKLEKDISSIEQKQFTLKEEIEQKEKILRQLRSERETYSEEIHNRELRIAELKLNADNLYRQIGEEYNWDLKQEQIDETYEFEKDEQEIDTLKQRIKNLGPVNLLALKEYESEKERLDFLKKQHDDLTEAKQNLIETVTHINKTASDNFNEVFQKIRENYNQVFHQFFKDGEADLILSEDEDPLEANIEIMANPKGKRPTSLTLLSGGEKALTAISLLFAIYLVKPSPFCILDEVDAPLDDTNIQRFTAALRDFSKDTQFLLVTHNKLTMKSTDCLYGITMEESGVSKVVSVKLE